MSKTCCKCCPSSSSLHKSGLPMICLVPRGKKDSSHSLRKTHKHKDSHHKGSHHDVHHSSSHKKKKGFKLLSDEYIRKNFKLPPRPLYLDPYRRPLITFPMADEGVSPHFTVDRKQKINQQILDGTLSPGAQICEPSVFPYAKSSSHHHKKSKKKDDTELIYILQLPDLEHRCPIHNEIVKTPRFIWHSAKKSKDKHHKHGSKTEIRKPGGGPLHKPKPWLLSRHIDFDYYSQW